MPAMWPCQTSSVHSGSATRRNSWRPLGSNRQTYTCSALPPKTAKLMPEASAVAPNGQAAPAETRPSGTATGVLAVAVRRGKASAVMTHQHGGERRYRQLERAGLAVGRHPARHHPATIAEVAAAVNGSVRVEQLAISAARRHADAIGEPRHRGEVADGNHRGGVAPATAIPGKHAVGVVIDDEPAEALTVVIEPVQRRLVAVETVQVGDQLLHAPVQGLLERRPIQLSVVAPFPRLSEFSSHEQQLLAGLRPHEAEVGAQIRKALPGVPRHAPEERPLAVH